MPPARLAVAVAAVALLGLAACPIAAPSTECASHLDCPEGYLCHPAHGFCVWDSYRASFGDAGRDAGLIAGDANQDALGPGDAGGDGATADAASPLPRVELRVWSGVEQVAPGQAGLGLSLRLRNLSGQALQLEQARPRMFMDQREVTDQYDIAALPDHPDELAPASTVELRYTVEVRASAELGEVRLDATAALRAPGGELIEVPGATWPDTWLVGVAQLLVVTTADDEDDTNGTYTVDAAGGRGDLSLREALLIAAAAEAGPLIRFDPTVFPPGGGMVIVLERALPPITTAGTVLDGSGAGVLISGNDDPGLDGPGLEVLADDVSVQHVVLAQFRSAQSLCLSATGVRGLRLLESQFLECSRYQDNDVPGVVVDFSQDILVRGCTFGGSRMSGLSLGSAVNGATVVDCDFFDNDAVGLLIEGVQVEVHGSRISGNDSVGVWLRGASAVNLADSVIDSNGRGNWSAFPNHGVLVDNGSSQISIDRCRVANSGACGILVKTAGSTAVRISQGSFAANPSGPLCAEAGALLAPPPFELSFSGGTLSGRADAAGGTVEVYAVPEAGTYRYLASAQVQADGTWQVALDAPGSVAATLTPAEGSTSPFSEVYEPELQLVVTTAEDELDHGPDLRSLADAGGAADLSLREAITIANNRPGPDTITFDPAVFLPEAETLIRVGGGPAGQVPLPAISDAGSTLDGRGAGAVISGGGWLLPQGLLVISADAVTLNGLALRDCASAAGACIYSAGAFDNVRILNCALRCSSSTSRGVLLTSIIDRTGVEISDCHIAGCAAGVELEGVTGAVLRRCEIADNTGEGVQTTDVSGLDLIDNDLHHNANVGMRLFNVMQGSVVGNRIWSNLAEGIKLERDDTTRGILIAFNTFYDNQVAVAVGNAVLEVAIRDNIMAAQRAQAIVHQSASWTEDHNLFFDNAGDGVTGASAVQGRDPVELADTDVLADPEIDPASGNFTPGAAAIDKGVDIGLDRNGERAGLFDRAAPDLGAVEVE